RILRKALLIRAQLHHDVWTKPPDFEATLRIQLAQAIERGRGQYMDHGTVEECLLGQREIRDRVPVVEAFHVRPVLLGIDRPAPGGTKCHLTVECLREDLVEITLVTGDSGAIGEGNSDGRDFRGRTWRLDECGAEIEETRPFRGVFAVAPFPSGLATRAFARTPSRPRSVSLGAVRSFSILD